MISALVGCTGGGRDARVGGATTARGALRITAASTRPEYVTGGDVLVQVDGVADGSAPVLEVDGRERPGALAKVEGDGWRGLVGDLPAGRSTLTVRDGDRSARLVVTDHPVAGPLLSGPHQEPYTCTTERNGLGPSTDADCSAPTVVRYEYVTADGSIRPLSEDREVPADAARATVGGRDVPLVVRTESGVINRGVYWVSVLDPTPSAPSWEGASDGWNGDLVYRFGGGCGTSYSQGVPLVGGKDRTRPTVDLDLLTRGYAVATDTLNTFQVHCNDVLSAETTMMVKEHFTETYGAPRHTIGDGGSGGAIQQFLLSQNYPGLLDAAVITAPFPDALSMAPGVTDCGLLDAFYATPDGAALTPEQRTAVNGHATDETCRTWEASFLTTIDPTTGCDLPPEAVYDPVRNRTGARCTLQDSARNLFGTDPATGFATRPIDNVGVQYGLQALEDKVITAEQFVRLNERIGGYDIDGSIQPQRSVAAEPDLRRLYSKGRILTGGGDSTRIPMIAINAYSDPTGDIHDRWRVFSARSRLDDAVGGRAENLRVWTVGGGGLAAALSGGDATVRNQALDATAEWVRALDTAGSTPASADRQRQLRVTRPVAAQDRCILPGGAELTGDDVYSGDNACTQAYPLAGDPRRAAGQPLEATAAKCRLRPIQPGEYATTLTDAQLERLRAVFPDGVCDWTKPGVGESRVRDTWIAYDGS
ncbi:MAG: DUF6351 family protein [Microthrixaceae bacterium]